jgi:hypothetical protein
MAGENKSRNAFPISRRSLPLSRHMRLTFEAIAAPASNAR